MSITDFMICLQRRNGSTIYRKWGNMRFAYRYCDFWNKWYYRKEDCYAIVGENEPLPEVLYVPAYCKEK